MGTPIIATDKGGGDDLKLPKAGKYKARCFSVVYMGHLLSSFKDDDGKDKWTKKVLIHWELPTKTHTFFEEKGEEPFSLYEEFNLSTDIKANLRKLLKNWNPAFTDKQLASFDVSKLVGKPCELKVGHKPNGRYLELIQIDEDPKDVPKQLNPSRMFSVDNFEDEELDALPEWIQKKVKTSKEYTARNQAAEVEGDGVTQEADEGLSEEGDSW